MVFFQRAQQEESWTVKKKTLGRAVQEPLTVILWRITAAESDLKRAILPPQGLVSR